MEEALLALLTAHEPLADLVGDRIAWDVKPQGDADPSVTLHLISDPPDYHMQGPSGYVQSRVQIDVRAPHRTQAKAAADAIEALLSGYSGTVGGVRFQGVFKDGSSRSSFGHTGAEQVYLRSHDYMIHSGPAA
jgi:hypothetical protein